MAPWPRRSLLTQTARKARRGWWRWLRRCLLALCGLLVVALLSIAILLFTPWGKGKVLSEALDRINPIIAGHLAVAELSGSLLSAPVLEDLTLYGADDKELARIKQIRVSYHLGSLFHREVHVDALAIDNLDLTMKRDAEGSFDVLKALALVAPQAPSEDPWTVKIDRFTLSGSSLRYVDLGRDIRVENLQAQFDKIRVKGAELTGQLSSLSAHLPACGQDIEVSGVLQLSDTGARAEQLTIRSSESSMYFERMDLRFDTSTIDVHGSVVADKSLLQCILPQYTWRQNLSIAMSAATSKDSELMDVQLALDDEALTLEASINPTERTGTLHVGMNELEPGSVVVMGHETSVSGFLDIDIKGWHQGMPIAMLDGSLEGRFDEFAIAPLAVHAANEGKRVTWSIDGQGTRMPLDASGSLEAAEGGLVVDGSASMLGLDLADLIATGAAGRVDLQTSFKGPLEALRLSGSVSSKRMRYGAMGLEQLVINFEFPELGTSFIGKLDARVAHSRYGKRAIGPIHLELHPNAGATALSIALRAGLQRTGRVESDALVVFDASETRVELTRTLIGLADESLRGSQGRMVFRPGAEPLVEGFVLGAGLASIRLGGDLKRGLRAEVTNIDLSRLGRVLGLVPRVDAGVAQLDITLSRAGRRLDVDASLQVSKATVEGFSQPTSVSMQALVNASGASLQLDIDAQDRGSIALRAKGRRVLDLFDARRWKAMGLRGLRSATLSLSDFDLATFAPLMEGPVLRGRVQGELSVGAMARQATGSLVFSGVGREDLRADLEGELDLSLAKGQLSVTGLVQDALLGRARVDVALTPPTRLPARFQLSRDIWPLFDRLALDIEKLDFAQLNIVLAGLGLAASPLQRGGLLGSLQIVDRGREMLVDLHLVDGYADGHGPVKADLAVQSRNHASHYEFDARMGQQVHLHSAGDLTADWKDALLDLPATIQKAEAVAQLEGEIEELGQAQSEFGFDRKPRLSGRATMLVHVSGPLLNPRVEANATLLRSHLATTNMGSVHLHGSLDGDLISAKVLNQQTAGGRLELEVTARKSDFGIESLSVKGKRYDLSFLGDFAPDSDSPLASLVGQLNADLAVRDPLGTSVSEGWLQIDNAGLQLGGALMPLEMTTIRLEGGAAGWSLVAEGRSGSGRFAATGKGRLVAAALQGTSLQVEVEKLPLAVGALIYSVDGKAHASFHNEGLLKVDVEIDEGLVRIPINSFGGSEQELHPVDGLSDLRYVRDGADEAALEAGVDHAPSMRIRLVADETLRIRSEDAEALAALDLDITMLGSTPVIVGQAEVTRGRVGIFNRRYTVERALVTFEGRIPMNPRLDIKLRHDFPTMRLDVIVDGTSEEPKPHFESDPADYDQATLLGIFLGQAPGRPGDVDQLQTKAYALASNLALNALQDALGPLMPLGIDVLKIEPNEDGSNTYVAGEWITDNWFVTYRYHPAAEELDNVSELHSEYQLSNSWLLEGSVGDQGKHGIDILWLRRWED